ncbi:hypothetical protein [Pseudoalteromonas sp.]|uniref:hypothetical protein n=1 Tax=Pseudoalteromonas sp. TaxID=53249 RepID=UPI0023536854|nr:hypothetical protein [Pseudoalteromonas sp.]
MDNTAFTRNGAEFKRTAKPQSLGAPSNQVVYLVSTAPDADASKFPIGKAVFIGSDDDVAKLDGVGDGAGFLIHAVQYIRRKADCYLYVVRVEKALTEVDTITNIIGGINNDTGQRTGIAALASVKTKPTLIGAPGYSHNKGVCIALAEQGQRHGCMFVNHLESATVTKVTEAADLLGGSDDGFDNSISVVGNTAYSSQYGEITMPGDIVALGLCASIPVYENPGHQGVSINSVDHQFEYNYTVAATEGNMLNKHGVCYYATTAKGGYSIIGNRTLTGKFISDQGLYNEIKRKVQNALETKQGQRLTRTFINQQLLVINNWLESLINSEITAPKSRCYLHPTKNTAAELGNGRWYIVVEYDGYPVNENPVIELVENDELAAAALTQ